MQSVSLDLLRLAGVREVVRVDLALGRDAWLLPNGLLLIERGADLASVVSELLARAVSSLTLSA